MIISVADCLTKVNKIIEIGSENKQSTKMNPTINKPAVIIIIIIISKDFSLYFITFI